MDIFRKYPRTCPLTENTVRGRYGPVSYRTCTQDAAVELVPDLGLLATSLADQLRHEQEVPPAAHHAPKSALKHASAGRMNKFRSEPVLRV